VSDRTVQAHPGQLQHEEKHDLRHAHEKEPRFVSHDDEQLPRGRAPAELGVSGQARGEYMPDDHRDHRAKE
jgi:hypothetical protein